MKGERAAGLEAFLTVSRETRDRLLCYAEILTQWQRRINLVAPDSMADLWQRHFADSAQLWPLVPNHTESLVDLGSGAGFPGMVLAILGVSDVHLIERDQRKAAFLREVARATATPATIHAAPLESLSGLTASVVTARALAPLKRLVPMAERFSRPDTVWLFPKGRDVDKELTELAGRKSIHVERLMSITDPTAAILRIRRTGPWPTQM